MCKLKRTFLYFKTAYNTAGHVAFSYQTTETALRQQRLLFVGRMRKSVSLEAFLKSHAESEQLHLSYKPAPQ